MIFQYEILCSALVAQGIEQRFPVPCVGGSNPLGCIFIVIRGTAQRWISYDGMRKIPSKQGGFRIFYCVGIKGIIERS